MDSLLDDFTFFQLGSSVRSGFCDTSVVPQFINQSTNFVNELESLESINSRKYTVPVPVFQIQQTVTPSTRTYIHPWMHLLPQSHINSASNCVEQFQHMFGTTSDCVETINQKLSAADSPSIFDSSGSAQSITVREVNKMMRSQKTSERLPLVSTRISASLNFSNMQCVSVFRQKDDIVRKLSSDFDDEPDFYQKKSGACYEKFTKEYTMSRQFAQKQSFEVNGCYFCFGRNKLFHLTIHCRVLSKTQKCHQLATGVFCFKCLKPNHRTQGCKTFLEGCRKCQNQHHSEWTHELAPRLRELWGISSQQAALQKCLIEGTDWWDRHFSA